MKHDNDSKASSLAATLAIGVAAVIALQNPAAASQRHDLTQAGSCRAIRDQLVNLIVEQLTRPRYRHHWGRGIRRRGLPAPATTAKARRSEDAAQSGPSHYSRTNNQVVGVDEADRVKTDGRYIYTVHGNDVLIIKSWPASATSIVARFRLDSAPQQLFLNGNQLVAFSHTVTPTAVRSRIGRRYARGRAARATVIDIEDRARPRLVAHVAVDGQLLRARMIGDDVYMITSNALQLPPAFWQRVNRVVPSWRGRHNTSSGIDMTSVMGKAMIRGEVRRALASVAVEKLLPTIGFTYGSGHPPRRRPLVGCSDVYFPASIDGLGLISISRMSLRGGRVHASAVFGQGLRVYASKKSVYVASSNWSAVRRDTVIHKFRLSRSHGPRYAASGHVPGYLLNQFSLDEHRGYLRVATTDTGSRTWRWRGRRIAGAGNNLFVLRQRQGELAIVGQVRGLAPGERIYAARMVGDQGYLVTFRRTDPLYTIDLSNPRRPRVMGELKIPGFSSYIHPIGNGQLLTVGQNADQTGRVRGAHLQIFDVTDLTRPRRTHHYELTPGQGSSRSLAQHDHHAFTYDPRTRTLALPLTVYGYHRNGGHFNGVILVRVDPESGFRQLGSVEHGDLATRTRCVNASGSCAAGLARHWNVPVTRSLFVDGNLYTLSSFGLKVHQLSDLSHVASTVFAQIHQPARTFYLR